MNYKINSSLSRHSSDSLFPFSLFSFFFLLHLFVSLFDCFFLSFFLFLFLYLVICSFLTFSFLSPFVSFFLSLFLSFLLSVFLSFFLTYFLSFLVTYLFSFFLSSFLFFSFFHSFFLSFFFPLPIQISKIRISFSLLTDFSLGGIPTLSIECSPENISSKESSLLNLHIDSLMKSPLSLSPMIFTPRLDSRRASILSSIPLSASMTPLSPLPSISPSPSSTSVDIEEHESLKR